ncbi:unnamed protein product [Sympodiomycopsis kandeliae]
MATTTTAATSATTNSGNARPRVIPKPSANKPKSMEATWHKKDSDKWSFFEKALVNMSILQDPAGSEPPPVFEKTDPVPVMSVWTQWKWLLPRALPPLVVNWAYVQMTGQSVSRYIAGPLYLAYFIAYGGNLFRMLNRLTKHYGFFDGTVERDGIPDNDTQNVLFELLGVITLRAIFAFTFIYPSDQSDLFNLKTLLLLPFNLFINACVLDFWFYWYHRIMHETSLYKYHKKHHMTKHPNAALGAYADTAQEFIDMLGIPLLTFLVWRLDFTSWWFAQICTLYIEAGGHSGTRLFFTNPTAWPLNLVGLELCLEDHDLHHRILGWKKSGNYGKQTRLWDHIFGSAKPRIEGTKENIDWNNSVPIV